ncbi:Helix-turn-helix domain-containing protein [Paenibacillus algorifonticola]|uniref:Helix-turn-helix domain-containing protein n=1 Tax=Paenibacillus algorifonticola TaxID=684063 RepID=A0A1I2I8L3_9BACL|nr:helix-turn-helix transcriptional regulator [Paenibacillus algorifonticola]SFF37998.1 Helix-turn-helix domain-containing protein [Paenibacillus algorifonticola]
MERLTIDRHQQLAQFLRSRRERILPEQLGIPQGGRRRTPGLRRSEVAMLAGMSVEWYTYLEQGRKIQVSAEVLESLARVLQLDKDERKHMFFLAHRQHPLEERQQAALMVPGLQHFLDQMEAAPSYIIDERMNVVAWNAAFRAAYGDYQLINERERNLVWVTFTSPTFRKLKGEHWEQAAWSCLAQFRAGYGRSTEDLWWSEQIKELSGISEEFNEMWKRQEVLYAPEGHKVIFHPIEGKMVFEYLAFRMDVSPELQIIINTPVKGTETDEKIRRLVAKG